MTTPSNIVRNEFPMIPTAHEGRASSLRPSFQWADLFDAPLHDFPLRDEILFQFAPLAPGTDVLEIGPGPGFTAFRLRRYMESLTLLDATPELLVVLERDLGKFKSVGFLCADLAKLDSPGRLVKKFDAVYGLDVFEYVSNPGVCLQTIAGALRPGGFLFLTFPNVPPPKGDGVTWFNDRSELEALLEAAGFLRWEIFFVKLKPLPAMLYRILHEVPLGMYRSLRHHRGTDRPQTYEATWAFQHRDQFVSYKPFLHFYWLVLEVLMRLGGNVFMAKPVIDPMLGHQIVIRAWI